MNQRVVAIMTYKRDFFEEADIQLSIHSLLEVKTSNETSVQMRILRQIFAAVKQEKKI